MNFKNQKEGEMPKEEKREPKVDIGFNLGGILGGSEGLLGGILKGLNIEELLNTAEKLAEAKGDEEAKERIKKMREGLGGIKGKVDSQTVKSQGLGGLFSQILNFVEKANKDGEFTQKFAGGKGIITGGSRTRILGKETGGSLPFERRSSPEKFEAKRFEPPQSKKPEKIGKVATRELEFDVFEEENHIKVIGDMPGVKEEDIRYETKGKTLRVYTEAGRKYEKKIELSASVTKKANLSYKNGVLELTLTKRKTRTKKA